MDEGGPRPPKIFFMAQIPHKARRYGYRIKQRFREDPFSTLVLYALFFGAIFLIFAFRGLIATIFIKPIGIINPGSQPAVESSLDESSNLTGSDKIPLKSTGIYTVKSGDTLYGIADALEVDWEELAAINEVGPPYSLSVGQELKLPS